MSVITWVLSPEWDHPLDSMNARPFWAVRAKSTERNRSWATNAAVAALIPPLEHCIVEMVWTVPDRKVRDAENPMYDLKAVCDGLKDAGIVPDDVPKYMTKLIPRIEYVKGEQRVEYIVTGTPLEPA